MILLNFNIEITLHWCQKFVYYLLKVDRAKNKLCKMHNAVSDHFLCSFKTHHLRKLDHIG